MEKRGLSVAVQQATAQNKCIPYSCTSSIPSYSASNPVGDGLSPQASSSIWETWIELCAPSSGLIWPQLFSHFKSELVDGRSLSITLSLILPFFFLPFK